MFHQFGGEGWVIGIKLLYFTYLPRSQNAVKINHCDMLKRCFKNRAVTFLQLFVSKVACLNRIQTLGLYCGAGAWHTMLLRTAVLVFPQASLRLFPWSASLVSWLLVVHPSVRRRALQSWCQGWVHLVLSAGLEWSAPMFCNILVTSFDEGTPTQTPLFMFCSFSIFSSVLTSSLYWGPSEPSEGSEYISVDILIVSNCSDRELWRHAYQRQMWY